MLEDRGIPARGRKISNADLLTKKPVRAQKEIFVYPLN